MRVETDSPILLDKQQIINNITQFWDKLSLSWQEIWGSHIHHGYYEHESNEIQTPQLAQEKLIQQLSLLLDLKPGSNLLDAGCGMGGSALYLAERFNASVKGITLSSAQLQLANASIPEALQSQVQFHIEDVHLMNSIPNNTFDVVWSLESCEQFYNKELFILQAFRVLKKGGKLMLATWCADQECYEDKAARNYVKLCRTFDLPYTPTLNKYLEIITQYASILKVEDWSAYVKSSWLEGRKQLKKYSFYQLFKMGGLTGLQFVRKMKLLQQAFDSGQLRYGVIIAQK